MPKPSRRRPPSSPHALSSTWRCVASRAAGAACAVELAVVGGALLATEARRRRGIVYRERSALAHGKASPLLARRVHALERELNSIFRGVEKCKRDALLTASAQATQAA